MRNSKDFEKVEEIWNNLIPWQLDRKSERHKLFRLIDYNNNKLISLNEIDVELRKIWKLDASVLKNHIVYQGFHFAKNYQYKSEESNLSLKDLDKSKENYESINLKDNN